MLILKSFDGGIKRMDFKKCKDGQPINWHLTTALSSMPQ
jgi:hypothetical protein